MSDRVSRRKVGKQRLAALMARAETVAVIHYSCESFYDREDGSSPRITSIAVRNLGSGQTTSFSIHQAAEKNKKVSTDEIDADYDELEKRMLKDFYEYASKRESFLWLHWNMRDANYGFAAIDHRYQVLGGKPQPINESHRCDLARLLVDIYGVGYAAHPRLATLIKRNAITDRDFLTGQEEADAFTAKQYVKLHQSTLRKVDILANVVGRASDATLKTDAKLVDEYGGYLPCIGETLRTHWVFAALGVLGAAASIAALVLWLLS